MTRYLLDTNIVSYLLKRHPAVIRNFQLVAKSETALSTIVEGELRYGAERLPHEARIHTILPEFLRRATILPWDSLCAQRYAELRAQLEAQGRPLEYADTMIAAHALAHNLTLVTNDQAFKRITKLALEDWTNESRQA